MRKRVALGNIYLVDLFGQGVQHALHQSLACQHNGHAAKVGSAALRPVFLQPSRHALGLCGLGGGFYNFYLGQKAPARAALHVAERLRRQGVAESGNVFFYKKSGFASGVPLGVVFVVIPIEYGLLLKRFHEAALHAAQHVEAREDISATLAGTQRALLQPLGNAAIECALVGGDALGSAGVEGGIYFVENIPKPQELAPHLAALHIPETTAKMAHGLFGCAEGLFNICVVAHIGKEAGGVGLVLIHVVKVGEQLPAPAVKLVEGQRLSAGRATYIYIVYAAYGLYFVHHLTLREASEEFADGDVLRCPKRAVGATQVLVEEEAGALVGEHYDKAAKVYAVPAEQVVRYELQERFGGGHGDINR